MTYEEALEEADKKLSSWRKVCGVESTIYHPHTPTSLAKGYFPSTYSIEVNNPQGYFSRDGLFSILHSHAVSVHRLMEGGIEVSPDKRVRVSKLEDLFKDPLNITKEEAVLFELEYGFPYVEELIDVV